MKKIIFAMLMLAPVYVHAAEKCIQLDPSGGEACSSNYDNYKYKADWEATCPESNGIPVRGISACAKTPGTRDGNEVTVVEDLEFSSDLTGNKSCWCRMVSPAVSRWVFQLSYPAGDCAESCASFCATSSRRSEAVYVNFRQMLFSNLKD